MLCNGIKRRGFHVETVGFCGQMFQEISGIDSRGDEAVGGEKFGSWEFREVGWGSVGEHRVVEKIPAAGDDFRDMQQTAHRGGVRTSTVWHSPVRCPSDGFFR